MHILSNDVPHTLLQQAAQLEGLAVEELDPDTIAPFVLHVGRPHSVLLCAADRKNINELKVEVERVLCSLQQN